MSKVKTVIKEYSHKYFVTAMGAMAQGLFATLLIGTILNTIGKYVPFLSFLVEVSGFASSATGMAIGVAIAISLKSDLLVVLSSAVVGAMGNAIGAIITDGAITTWAASAKGEGGVFYSAGPAGAFFAVIIACEIGKLVSKKTRVDILVTPIVTILVGFGAAFVFCPLVAYVMYYLGIFIATATTFQPIIMGIVVAVVVGMILTLPISSAAICAMIFSTSALEVAVANGTEEGFLLAGGAAVVGCCAQMVGFAAMSFKENGWGGLASQGIGTSMLQMGNICKNPIIWIPPTLAGAICGPLSTMVFKLKCQGVSAGMGTCGLVGPIGVIAEDGQDPALMWTGLILLCIILPAVISVLLGLLFKKLGWIKENDLHLEGYRGFTFKKKAKAMPTEEPYELVAKEVNEEENNE
ncbi:MAG: PTS sugar transporter subunit IIC [Clostridia bacterium]|nr:PTS sugar transporter subunit IIC [Clostridia bacterium]